MVKLNTTNQMVAEFAHVLEAPPAAEKVNGYISDLFFNLDLSDAHLPADKNGHFGGYDDAKLLSEAQWFLDCLDRLGVHTPSANALISNFYSRI